MRAIVTKFNTLLAAAALVAAPAFATAATFNFDVEVTSVYDVFNEVELAGSPLIGTMGSGFYEFDAPGTPSSAVFLADSEFSLTVDFASGSETFTGSQDFAGAPLLSTDAVGNALDLNFIVLDEDTIFMAYSDQISAPNVIDIGITSVVVGAAGIEKVNLEVQIIPLPGALALMLGGVSLLGFAARRKA